jgi:hypothetical protein
VEELFGFSEGFTAFKKYLRRNADGKLRCYSKQLDTTNHVPFKIGYLSLFSWHFLTVSESSGQVTELAIRNAYYNRVKAIYSIAGAFAVDELRLITVTEYLDDIYYRWKLEVKDSSGYRAEWFDDWKDVIEYIERELKPGKRSKPSDREHTED